MRALRLTCPPRACTSQLALRWPAAGGDLHFFTFETRFIEDVIELVGEHFPTMRAQGNGPQQLMLRATGGGSYKHAAAFRRAGLVLDVGEEMVCIVIGLSFLLRNVPNEVFTVRSNVPPAASAEDCSEMSRQYDAIGSPPTDYLYVSIGSGVSILEVRHAVWDTMLPSGQPNQVGYVRRADVRLWGSLCC